MKLANARLKLQKHLKPSITPLFIKNLIVTFKIDAPCFYLRDYLFSTNDACYHILYCSRFP